MQAILDAFRLCAILAAVYEIVIDICFLFGNPQVYRVHSKVAALGGIGLALVALTAAVPTLMLSRAGQNSIHPHAVTFALTCTWAILFFMLAIGATIRVEKKRIVIPAYIFLMAAAFVTSYMDFRG